MTDHNVPPAPAWLARYPRALERWDDLWSSVQRTRIHPVLHRDIVAQYCHYYSDMRDALEHMERSKLVAEKKTIGVGPKSVTTIEKLGLSPYQSLFDNAVRSMERLGKMLGLDPLNPLEEIRTFADYAEILCDDGEGDDYVDDGPTGDGDGAGDAGAGPAERAGDAGGSETQVPTGATGETPVLVGRQDH